MPVTTFALLIVVTLVLGALTVWAMSAWGVLTVLPLVLILALTARWAMQSVPRDDRRA